MDSTPVFPSVFFETALITSLLLPALSGLLSFAIAERYSWLTSFIATVLMLISALMAGYVCFSAWNENVIILQWNWFAISGHNLTAGLYLDNLAVLMMLIVNTISFLVHLYSVGYMAGDEGIRRYFGMLGFFTFSMTGIALASNLLQLFLFWELVGFSSYLLIGHYQERPAAAAAAKKAFIFNRIGDVGFIIGLMIVWTNTATFDIDALQSFSGSESWKTLASFCFFCGVAGKSAQFPLLTWLPDAMEGPTPVSALIHAATMVAAGIFLLARIDFIFTVPTLNIVACVGALTALTGAAAALVQHDVKKILAYSTVSQLGLMVVAVGVGAPGAAMLHLMTHAFFKACLFLSAGSVIHALHLGQRQAHVHFDVQDIRQMGGLRKKLPFTFLAFVISGSALAGLPFLSGFISKEAILSSVLSWTARGGAAWQYTVVGATLLVSFITVLYVFRMIWKIFLMPAGTIKTLSVAESPLIMRIPIGVLAVASFWIILSWNPFAHYTWLYTAPVDTAVIGPHLLTTISIVWVATALGVAYRSRHRNFKARAFFNTRYLDTLYHFVIARPTLRMATLLDAIDRRWIDGFLHGFAYVQVTIASLTGWFDRAIVDGIVGVVVNMAQGTGSLIRSFQEGKIQLYVLWSSLAIIIFLIWTLL